MAARHAVEAALALDPDYLAAHALREQMAVTVQADGVSRQRPSAPHVQTSAPSSSPHGGWVRFEARARNRRIEKRAEAARAAIELRRSDEARAAIAEIREIDPAHPELVALESELDGASHGSRRGRAVVLIVAASACAALMLLPGLRVSPSRTTPPVAATPPQAGANRGDAAQPPERLADSNVAGTTGGRVEAGTGGTGDAVAGAGPVAEPSVERRSAAAESAPTPAIENRAAEPPERDGPARVDRLESAPPPAVRTPVTPVSPWSVPSPGSTDEAITPPDEVSPPPSSPPVFVAPAVVPTPPAPTPPVPVATTSAATDRVTTRPPQDEALARRVLQQYRTAYETLSARAVQQVWPGVDTVALQRAFDGLQSQRLLFDDCTLDLRGSAGTAVCRGTTRYVPKVGSRDPREDPRVWTFSLDKRNDQWLIRSARAER